MDHSQSQATDRKIIKTYSRHVVAHLKGSKRKNKFLCKHKRNRSKKYNDTNVSIISEPI